MNSYLVGATGLNFDRDLCPCLNFMYANNKDSDENVRVCLLVCLHGSCYILSIMLHCL